MFHKIFFTMAYEVLNRFATWWNDLCILFSVDDTPLIFEFGAKVADGGHLCILFSVDDTPLIFKFGARVADGGHV